MFYKKDQDAGQVELEINSYLESIDSSEWKFSLIDSHQDDVEALTVPGNKSELYHNVADHHELYVVGSYFQKELSKGSSRYCFYPVGGSRKAIETILGLVGLFEHQTEKNILILSETDIDLLNQYWGKHETDYMQIADGLASLEKRVITKHVDHISVGDVLSMGENIRDLAQFDECLEYVFSSYDIVFAELPPAKRVTHGQKYYYPLIMQMDSVSYVVSAGKDNYDDVISARRFFHKHNISEHGILFEKATKR